MIHEIPPIIRSDVSIIHEITHTSKSMKIAAIIYLVNSTMRRGRFNPQLRRQSVSKFLEMINIFRERSLLYIEH